MLPEVFRREQVAAEHRNIRGIGFMMAGQFRNALQHGIIVHPEAEQHDEIPQPLLDLREALHRVALEAVPPDKLIAGKDAGDGNAILPAHSQDLQGAVPHAVERHRLLCIAQVLPQRLRFVDNQIQLPFSSLLHEKRQ